MKKMIINLLMCICFSLIFACNVYGEELTPTFVLPNGGDAGRLTDEQYEKSNITITSISFNAGDKLTVSAKDGSKISGIYIIWHDPISNYTIETDNGIVECGQYGFIHDYVDLKEETSKVVINIPSNKLDISTIRIFSKGELPKDVQVWNPPCEKADILLVPAHADDEILFFGGIIPTYAVTHEAQIQVAYMAEFWSSAPIREHEKLNGLWEAGLRNYPTCGGFIDVYSESIAVAKTQYNYDKLVEFVTGQIRRFEPQVVVTHDKGGEYGHGFHMLTSLATTDAIDAAADETKYTDSVKEYGVWTTPKTYLHILPENQINLNLRVPIKEMGGRTALEIAADAYKKHLSQQWCWFYVSDEYEYSCAKFGLFKTNVGTDVTDDLLSNLKTYAKIAEEEEAKRLEEERLEAERIEAEQKAEAERIEKEKASEAAKQKAEADKKKKDDGTKKVLAILTVAMLLVLGIVATIWVIRHGGNYGARRRKPVKRKRRR